MAKASSFVSGENFVQALNEFTYDNTKLSLGQVFELRGTRNDQRLLDLRYLRTIEPGLELYQCAECGELFINEHWRERHGDRYHALECACGWSPSPGILDRETAIRRHRSQCPSARAEWEERHKAHVARQVELDS